MKAVFKVIGVLLLVVIGIGVYFLIQYPYLAPWYHKKYNAEAYQDEVSTVASISFTDTETCLVSRFERLYPYWLGTSYNFNGITEVPGEGAIACGYFVTTLVRDMHFDIPRIQLAQMASEEMITALVDSTKIKRYNKSDNATMLSYLESQGSRLYLVGLDNHTGFLYHDGADLWMIHSSGRFPYAVIKEKARDSKVLLESNYKVVGNISESRLIWEF